jgi:hypothetical protein
MTHPASDHSFAKLNASGMIAGNPTTNSPAPLVKVFSTFLSTLSVPSGGKESELGQVNIQKKQNIDDRRRISLAAPGLVVMGVRADGDSLSLVSASSGVSPLPDCAFRFD